MHHDRRPAAPQPYPDRPGTGPGSAYPEFDQGYGATRPMTPATGASPRQGPPAQRRSSGGGRGRAADAALGGPRPSRSRGARSPRGEKQQARAAAREARWRANRYAVPYWTDGPKVSLGVAWFLAMAGSVAAAFYYDSTTFGAVGILVVGGVVAAIAGLQTGFAWFPQNPATRSWTAGAAAITAAPALIGGIGVIIGVIVGLIVLAFYTVLYRGHRRPPAELFDVLARSAIPAGLAIGSLVAMVQAEPGGRNAALVLILMVSAYEVGDFLVGSGSNNAFEGPLAGVIALGVIAFFLFLITPEPFTTTSALLFSAIAALSCPLGQMLASALLPRGTSWAPALRRLDSYLVAAPLWLLLIAFSPALPT